MVEVRLAVANADTRRDAKNRAANPDRKESQMTTECGIHNCKRFGQRPTFGLWLHNLLRHRGK